jgi:uncharacterized protein YktB (UPF0637 family)
MDFPVFAESDFEIFSIPEFGARMGAIRTELRPKLLVLGEALAPYVAEFVSGTISPHAASHMRRRTNPPPATWVAFGRSARGYKRFVHFRVAVHGSGLRVSVQVDDDADDKPLIAESLRCNSVALVRQFSREPDLVWYSLQNGSDRPVTGAELKAADLRRLGDTLGKLKTSDFSAGVPFDRSDPRLRSPADLPPLLLDTMRRLAPLYEAALPNDDLMT